MSVSAPTPREMTTLAAVLLRNQAAPIDAVENAMLRQSLYGGDLATNLLELAAIDEGMLLEQLSIAFEMETVAAGPLAMASDELKQALPADVGARHSIFPLALSNDELSVAVCVPLSPSVLEDLAFSLGYELTQSIALEVRIRQALSRDYRLPFAERYVRLSLSLDSGQPLNLSIPPPRVTSRNPLNSLRGESLPNDVNATNVPTLVSSRSAALSNSTPKQQWPIVTKPQRRLGPFTSVMAERELKDARSAKDILRLWLDFCAQFFEFAVIFTTQGEMATGNDSRGLGPNADYVSRIGIPLEFPSVLADARRSGRWNLATLSADGINATFARDMQRKTGRKVFVIPAMLRGRAVALLYGDQGDADAYLEQVGEVVAITSVVERALGRVLISRKKGRAAEPAEAASHAPDPSITRITTQVSATSIAAASERPPQAAQPVEDAVIDCESQRPALAANESSQPISSSVYVLPSVPALETNATSQADPAPPDSRSQPPRVPETTMRRVDSDYEGKSLMLIHRIIDGDESAIDELLSFGDAGASVLVRELPGPVKVPVRSMRPDAGPVRASECGPLLRAMVAFGTTARPYVIARTADADPTIRQWATRLLGELPGRQSAMAVAQRMMHDRDPEVRRGAFVAGQLLTHDFESAQAIQSALSGAARNETLAVTQRLAALDALSDLRNGQAIPSVTRILLDANPSIRAAARQTLCNITCRDFGYDIDAWSHWWAHNGHRHRVEWLMDSLLDDSPTVRQSAFDELRAISRIYIGQYDDNVPEQRLRVQERYRQWWNEAGRAALSAEQIPS